LGDGSTAAAEVLFQVAFGEASEIKGIFRFAGFLFLGDVFFRFRLGLWFRGFFWRLRILIWRFHFAWEGLFMCNTKIGRIALRYRD